MAGPGGPSERSGSGSGSTGGGGGGFGDVETDAQRGDVNASPVGGLDGPSISSGIGLSDKELQRFSEMGLSVNTGGAGQTGFGDDRRGDPVSASFGFDTKAGVKGATLGYSVGGPVGAAIGGTVAGVAGGSTPGSGLPGGSSPGGDRGSGGEAGEPGGPPGGPPSRTLPTAAPSAGSDLGDLALLMDPTSANPALVKEGEDLERRLLAVGINPAAANKARVDTESAGIERQSLIADAFWRGTANLRNKASSMAGNINVSGSLASFVAGFSEGGGLSGTADIISGTTSKSPDKAKPIA